MPLCCLRLCKICRLSREEKLFEQGRRLLRHEMDIVEVIKKIRRLEMFLKAEFSRKDLEKSDFIVLDDIGSNAGNLVI